MGNLLLMLLLLQELINKIFLKKKILYILQVCYLPMPILLMIIIFAEISKIGKMKKLKIKTLIIIIA